MISRYEAYMDGTALSSIDPTIYVLDIQPADPSPKYTLSGVARRDGSVIENTYYEKAAVAVEFEIHEPDPAKRELTCQKIRKWAKKGILQVSTKPGQRLDCVCESFPVANAHTWTEPIQMSFAGYNPPYWEELNPTTVTLSGESDSGSVYVPGNADKAFVWADVACTNAITEITLTVGNTSMKLTGLSTEADDHIYVGYSKGYLYIKKNTVSIMDKRTAASSDDLIADCGVISSFSFSASASVSVTFKVRGCWM